jgi:hypothetical protein
MKQTVSPGIIASHFKKLQARRSAGRAILGEVPDRVLRPGPGGAPRQERRALLVPGLGCFLSRISIIGLALALSVAACAGQDATTNSTVSSTNVAVNLATNRTASSNNITGSASLAVLNQYIFRGYQIGKNSVVLQPTATAEYRGFAVTFWGNVDTQEHATPNFVPDRPGQASFNEADVSLSYTHSFGKLSLTGGIWYYGTQYMDDTEELFVSATYDVITKPTLTVYRDINSFPATYYNLSLAHSIPVGRGITVDLGAAAGYLAGDCNLYKTEGGTGPVYSAFHDGMVKVGLTIPVAKDWVVQPVVQYYFPLSEEAGRTGYNPSGELDQDFVYGVSATFSF